MFRKLIDTWQSQPMTRDEALTFWISIGTVVFTSLIVIVR